MNPGNIAKTKVVILGGGPAGIGAAWRLRELGIRDWAIYEKEKFLGGLASSSQDEKGFVWDNGGHIYFSKSEYFNNVFDRVMAGKFYRKKRNQFIFLDNAYLPYPFQNHIRYLQPKKLLECIAGLLKAQAQSSQPKNFSEFNLSFLGEGIFKHFMRPYNEKIWGWPLEQLSYSWTGGRVSPVNLEKIFENIILSRDERQWGPNYYFKYPKRGGSGGFWRRFGDIFAEKVNFEREFERIDVKNKKIYFTGGLAVAYDNLISTLPLDFLAKRSNLSPAVKKTAAKLKHNSGIVIGVGIKGELPRILRNKIAVYFPEKKYCFHRATLSAYFSPHNVPPGHWGMAFEITESPHKNNPRDILKNIMDYLEEQKFIHSRKNVITIWRKDVPHFYPVPTLDRDAILSKLAKTLEQKHIYSVGRFGSWKYELGNMDHGFLQGVGAIDKIFRLP